MPHFTVTYTDETGEVLEYTFPAGGASAARGYALARFATTVLSVEPFVFEEA